MKQFSYRISKKAIEDLEKIWNYTFEKWSLEQADRHYELIISEIEFISNNFMTGKSMDYIKSGYRASIIKSHLVFYRMADDNVVEIIRILHQRVDIDNRITE